MTIDRSYHSLSDKRIAVVHDFLYVYAGAERVLEQILKLFPQADLYSLFDFLPESERGFIQNKTVHPTFIQRLPFARRNHRRYLPLMPLAIEQLDFSSYDIVISSSYVAAKGVITRGDQFHLCYCHSPVRFAWDLQHQYLAESGLTRGVKSIIARTILHYIRNWDSRCANGVDAFVTNSHFVANRVRKLYRRNATPVHPPVDTEQFQLHEDKDRYYVTASRMVPYKRMDLLVKAFARMPDRQLMVIGDGPEMPKIRACASPNVTLLGHLPFDRMLGYLQRARAFVFAAEEDFGIAPVEAMACGTPVIAFGRGGVKESVTSGVSGLFFNEQSIESVIQAVEEFEAMGPVWDAREIRSQAERFRPSEFRRRFIEAFRLAYGAFEASRSLPAELGIPADVDPLSPPIDSPQEPSVHNPSGIFEAVI